MPRWDYVLIAAAVLLILFWMVWPSRIDPVSWDEPQPPDMTGPLAPNNRLAVAEVIAQGEMQPAEDLALAPDGSVYTGTLSGHIQRIAQDPQTGEWRAETLFQVTNRALLGIDWVDDQTLVIAGLDGLHIANLATGQARAISTGSPTRPFGFVNDVTVGPDGTIYFTDSTTGWEITDYAATSFRSFELLENRPHGFVYALNPRGGATRVVLERLYYPNGIAMSSDETALLIVETTRFAVRRHLLTGPQAGTSSILADNLPGVPDGIYADGQGRVFVSMVGHRRPFQRFLNRNPLAVWILYKLGYRPSMSPFGADPFIVVLDESTGEIIDSFHGQAPGMTSLANAVPGPDGQLWMASDAEDFLARIELPRAYDAPRPGWPEPGADR